MYDVDTAQDELTMWADVSPTPVFNFPAWKDPSFMDKGNCVGQDVNLFHPSSNAGINKAKRFCATCPVQRECLEYGISMDPSSEHGEGIWGGATPNERRAIANGEDVTLFAECVYPPCRGVVPQTFNKTYCNRVCAERHAQERKAAA